METRSVRQKAGLPDSYAIGTFRLQPGVRGTSQGHEWRGVAMASVSRADIDVTGQGLS